MNGMILRIILFILVCYHTSPIHTISQDGGIILKGGNNLGDDPYNGRVEICHNSEWGTICDDLYVSYKLGGNDQTNMNNVCIVICKQLGYTICDDTSGLIDNGPKPYASGGLGNTWLDDIVCSGTESKIGDCIHDQWGDENCNHQEDITIQCSGYIGGGYISTECGTSPSISPTSSPSISPSSNPSVSPSTNPSMSPSTNPSISSSSNPSTSPLTNLSISPTLHPSIIPTLNPSMFPTSNPSTSSWPTSNLSQDKAVNDVTHITATTTTLNNDKAYITDQYIYGTYLIIAISAFCVLLCMFIFFCCVAWFVFKAMKTESCTATKGIVIEKINVDNIGNISPTIDSDITVSCENINVDNMNDTLHEKEGDIDNHVLNEVNAMNVISMRDNILETPENATYDNDIVNHVPSDEYYNTVYERVNYKLERVHSNTAEFGEVYQQNITMVMTKGNENVNLANDEFVIK